MFSYSFLHHFHGGLQFIACYESITITIKHSAIKTIMNNFNWFEDKILLVRRKGQSATAKLKCIIEFSMVINHRPFSGNWNCIYLKAATKSWEASSSISDWVIALLVDGDDGDVSSLSAWIRAIHVRNSFSSIRPLPKPLQKSLFCGHSKETNRIAFTTMTSFFYEIIN